MKTKYYAFVKKNKDKIVVIGVGKTLNALQKNIQTNDDLNNYKLGEFDNEHKAVVYCEFPIAKAFYAGHTVEAKYDGKLLFLIENKPEKYALVYQLDVDSTFFESTMYSNDYKNSDHYFKEGNRINKSSNGIVMIYRDNNKTVFCCDNSKVSYLPKKLTTCIKFYHDRSSVFYTKTIGTMEEIGKICTPYGSNTRFLKVSDKLEKKMQTASIVEVTINKHGVCYPFDFDEKRYTENKFN